MKGKRMKATTLLVTFLGLFALRYAPPHAVATPGAPLLWVALTPTNSVRLTWVWPATGWVLQQKPDLAAANWAPVTNIPQLVGSDWQVIVIPTPARCFYRLVYVQAAVPPGCAFFVGIAGG
jgi:hypothetical protein